MLPRPRPYPKELERRLTAHMQRMHPDYHVNKVYSTAERLFDGRMRVRWCGGIVEAEMTYARAREYLGRLDAGEHVLPDEAARDDRPRRCPCCRRMKR